MSDNNEHGNILGALGTNRGLSLVLAVLHHGLANFADKSIPAGTQTVIATAERFEDHLDTDYND